MDSLDGILSKLDNPSLGVALGFFMTEVNRDQKSGQPMFNNLMSEINGLMTQAHFPNVSHVITELVNGWSADIFKGAIMAGAAGWVLDEVDMNPTISRMGKLLKTLGFNGALGSVAATLLLYSSWAHSDGGAGSPAGAPYAGHNGYPAGAGYSPLGRRDGGYFTMPTVKPATPTLPAILPASPPP